MKAYCFIPLLSMMITSCVNNMEEVKRISFSKNSPDEVMVDFTMNYSERGLARVKVYAAYSESYLKPQHITHLRDSLRVTFYSDKGEVVSTLTAKYGRINHVNNEIILQDSIRFYHFEKQQLLKTERLFWHQNDSTISTDKAVIITSPKVQFNGKGLKAKQDFSEYVILRPEGTLVIESENEFK